MNKAKSFLLLVSILFFSCSSSYQLQQIQQQNIPQSEIKTPQEQPKNFVIEVKLASWIDSTLNTLSIRKKVAQLFVVWAPAKYLSNDSKTWQELLRYASEVGVGGFYFSTGGAYEFPIHANKLQSESKIPLLISADFEWGAGMRIDDATTFPRAMALGATRDTNLAYEMGYAIAQEARALGVHQNYAPDVDVNKNPKNPVINTRSFSEDQNLVSKLSRAFIRGEQDGGIIATVKHFPGHGDTDIDTHLELPSIHSTRARLDSIELLPFNDAIKNGVMSVMIGHIHASAFDSSNIPASISENVITKLLKNELGFEGLIVSDALAMKGISKLYNSGEIAIRAFKAGNDVLLMSPNTDEAIDSLVNAIQRGEILQDRLDYSVKKILHYKKYVGLDKQRFVNVDSVSAIVGQKEHLELAKKIARKSNTVVGNEDGILPLRNLNGKKILTIVFSDEEDPDGNNDLYFQIKQRNKMDLVIIDPRSNQMEFDETLKKTKSADLIICQFSYHMNSGTMSGFMPKKISDMVKEISLFKKPIVGISTGNPYIAMDIPKLSAFIFTYGSSSSSKEACAEVIFGEQPACGKLPITIPGKYSFDEGVEYPVLALRKGKPEDAGCNSDSLSKVDGVINKAIADSAFPGAVLLVAKDGIIIHEKAYGKFTYDSSATTMFTDAIFDLASVTKVISTTSAMMRLVEEKKIRLTDPVIKYFPAFGKNGKEKITIYNLMVHNSGLQGWRKYYEFCDTPSCVVDSIFAAPLTYTTGDSTIYSDLGLITIGKIIEKVTGKFLDKYVDSVFFKPLGMKNTVYNPPQTLLERIVPTEIDSFWKKTYLPVHGRVHDENAATLGGVSGHAGLFSTASDLAIILQMELNGGMYNGVRYLKRETIDRFTKKQSEKSSRAIGWDTRSTGQSFSGKFTSPKTFLHTGFTGTSVVVDPEKNIIVIFLTNRVYPTRNNPKLARVRPAVHNTVFSAIK